MDIGEVVAVLKLNMLLLEEGTPDIGSHPQRVRDSLRDLAGRLAEEGIDAEDDPDQPAGPGFVCLSIAAHDRLRESAELAEARKDQIDAYQKSQNQLGAENSGLRTRLHEARVEIERLKHDRPDPARFPINPEPGREGDRIEPFTPGPMHVMPGTTADPVVHRHLRDLQAEVDGLKDRLEEGCRQHQALNARVAALEHRAEETRILAENHDRVLEEFGGLQTAVGGIDRRQADLSDRLQALVARMNRIEAPAPPGRIAPLVAPFTSSPA